MFETHVLADSFVARANLNFQNGQPERLKEVELRINRWRAEREHNWRTARIIPYLYILTKYIPFHMKHLLFNHIISGYPIGPRA